MFTKMFSAQVFGLFNERAQTVAYALTLSLLVNERGER